MTAKPKFSQAPRPAALTPKQQAFIDGGPGKDRSAGAGEPVVKLSIEVPRSLHKRFKVACELADVKMTPEVLDFIERRTAELEAKTR